MKVLSDALRIGSVLGERGFGMKGRCPFCNSRRCLRCDWEVFCMACRMGTLSDDTYAALGWERPSSTLPKVFLPSPVRWVTVPEEAAVALGVPAGVYLYQPDIAEAAEKWDSDALRIVANIETPA